MMMRSFLLNFLLLLLSGASVAAAAAGTPFSRGGLARNRPALFGIRGGGLFGGGKDEKK